MYELDGDIKFPHLSLANNNGVLAIGGDLSVERLILAYRNGIFPWFSDEEPIIWWSPNPRMVLYPEKLKVSKSMRKVIRDGKFRITYNEAFAEVIGNCKTIYRNGQLNTWITNDMKRAYIDLHNIGVAHSVEVWQEDELVGGLYGLNIGKVFCGESMFSKKSNASKIAFITLVRKLEEEDYFMIDCQVYNDHLASLGAIEVNRDKFISDLYEYRDKESWDFSNV
jgi:leucyl/phenylalanyl-tRNA--protein transferase